MSAAHAKPVRKRVILPLAALHKAPEHTSMMETQLLWGGQFDISSEQKGWAWGQEVAGGDAGYRGYMRADALALPLVQASLRICVLRAPVFKEPDIKSTIKMFLPLNARINSDAAKGDYIHVSDLGFIHQNHVKPLGETGGDFTAIAEQHLALPYVWGGIGPDGLDCSGLVQTALRACGVQDAPRDSHMQESALGDSVDVRDDLSGLKRGDLVFWQGHVGIMQNQTMLLHANAHHMLVASEPLKHATHRIAKSAGPITAIKRLARQA